MIAIQQALFGYSNGHHLLASSQPLDSQDLKVLEPLSDLSGIKVSTEFDGYLTGYPISNKTFYALSKTWYAKEMNRPGCVWTQTLLIPYQIQKEQLKGISFDNLFSRPSTDLANWKSIYSEPIYLDTKTMDSQMPANEVISLANGILSLLIENTSPIIISANRAAEYNAAFEYLIKSIGPSFFEDISFCTGSFSNRNINGSYLDIQVVPRSIPKSSWRSNFQNRFITEPIESGYSDFPYNSCYSVNQMIEAKRFLSTLKGDYYSRKYLKIALDFIQKINNPEMFSAQDLLTAVEKTFEDDAVATFISEAFSRLLLDNIYFTEDSLKTKILLDFCTSKSQIENWTSRISEVDLESIIDNIWASSSSLMCTFFVEMFDYELNYLGERTAKYIAKKITIDDFQYLLDRDSKVITVIVRLNWKLALSKDIWKKPYEYQSEILKTIAVEYQHSTNSDEALFRQVIRTIFNISNEDMAMRLYRAFNTLAITTFFEWALTVSDFSKISRWVNICKFNSNESISELMNIQSSEIFQQVIRTLNPYEKEMQTISPNTLNELYEHFCVETNNDSNRITYAQFILPIILQTEYKYPDRLIRFAFLTVHKILSEDKMEYSAWEKLSTLLPEVAWYNSWDKCKRLRKASKNRKLDLNFSNM